jgi:hypothetical protein
MMLFGFGLGKWLMLYRCNSHESFRLDTNGKVVRPYQIEYASYRHTHVPLPPLAWANTLPTIARIWGRITFPGVLSRKPAVRE